MGGSFPWNHPKEWGDTDASALQVPGAEPRRIMPARLPDLTVAEQADEGKRMDSAAEKAKL